MNTKSPSGGNLTGIFCRLLHRCDWETSAVRSIPYPNTELCTRIALPLGTSPLQGFTHLLARRFSGGLVNYIHISRHAAQYKAHEQPNTYSWRRWFHTLVRDYLATAWQVPSPMKRMKRDVFTRRRTC